MFWYVGTGSASVKPMPQVDVPSLPWEEWYVGCREGTETVSGNSFLITRMVSANILFHP